MAAAWVQDKSTTGFSGTTIAIAFDANVTSGNWVAVFVAWGDATSTASLAQSAGTATIGTVSEVLNPTTLASPANRCGMFYAKVTGTGSLTLTATFSASVPQRVIVGHEISGLDGTAPLVGQAAQGQSDPGTGTDAVTSGAFTPSADNAYVFGATSNVNTATAPVAGTGFTIRESNGRLASEELIQGTAASVAATFTASASTHDFMTGAMAFKPAAGAGPAIPVFMAQYRQRWN